MQHESSAQETPPGQGSAPAEKIPVTTFEKAAAIAIVALAMMHIALYAGQMAHTSMWTDELGAIKDFFEPGPWHAVTNYPIPRNHVFFSFLDSLFPHAGDVDPLRARFLSFIFAAAIGAGILWHYFRAGRWFEGALVFALWGFNGELLQLSLQARGYGLLCLFAFWSALLALRYTENKRPSTFVLLTLCTAFGSYTIPSYVFFGAPLLLLLAAVERDKKAFFIAVGGGVLIALLYAPIARQVFEAAAKYRENYGEYYIGPGAVLRTMRLAWPLPLWAVVIFSVAACVIPFFPWPAAGAKARALRCLIIAVLLFLAACLFMRTPPVRTTCFVALPLVLCLGEIAGRFYRTVANACVRLAVCIAFFVSVLFAANGAMRHFHFVPYENWELAWRFTETMFPRGTLIDCSNTANGLTYYVDQDHYAINLTRPIDRAGFAAGKVPVVSAPWKNESDHFPAATYSTRAVSVTAPGRIRDVTIWFVPGTPPEGSGVKVSQSGTASVISVEIPREIPRCHSLNLILEDAPEDIGITAATTVAGRKIPLDCADTVRIGAVFTIPLQGQPMGSFILETTAPVRLKGIWIVPEP